MNAQDAPEPQFAEAVLQLMAATAKRHGIAIRRLDPCAAVSSQAHMRSLRGGCFAASDAGKLSDKRQVLLRAPAELKLRLARRYHARDARRRHRLKKLQWISRLDRFMGLIPRL